MPSWVAMDEQQEGYPSEIVMCLAAGQYFHVHRVIVVFNPYVQNPDSQIKQFILLLSYRIWQRSVSSSCPISCIQDQGASLTNSCRFNGGPKM